VGVIPIATPDALNQVFTSPYGTWTANHYTIDIRQFNDVLHPDFITEGKPAYISDFTGTKLWGFNPASNPTQNQKHLGGVIVATKGVPIQITFQNFLPNQNIIPVDATIPGVQGLH
jgi:spore coat protein A